MVDEVGSNLIHFADDTKLWRIIRNQEDRDVLQKDLDILVTWSRKWMLKFIQKNAKYYTLGPETRIMNIT